MKRLKMIKLFREAGSTRPELDAEVEELLTSGPLFAELSRRAYLEVVRTMTRVSMDRGEVLFEEGSRGDSFYVILSGSIKVWRSRGKKRVVLATLEPGQTFGEMTLISGLPRTATAEATQATRLLELKRKPLRRLSARHRCLGRALRRFYKSRFVGDLTSSSPLFAPLSEEQQQQIVDKLLVYNHPRGHTILKQGIHGNGLHIIMHGKVRVYRELPDGKQQLLARLGPGEMFGEISI